MSVYEIEQYELHTMTHQVEADNVTAAIVKLLDGEVEPQDNTLEYVEIADERGLFADDHPELAEQLRSLSVPVDQVIPSIRCVIQVDGVHAQPTVELN